MNQEAIGTVARGITVAVVGIGFVIGGITSYNEGEALHMWLPQISWGTSIVLSYGLWKFGGYLDRRHGRSVFRAQNVGFLIGLLLWAMIGILFVLFGWRSLLVLIYAITGVLGMLFGVYLTFSSNNLNSP